ncbi:hypothetical protein TcYC6_0108330 [Trypanosoma cruzi]|nr:hypothetical protein TcYC6_0108330 [Trypanosoma cruzi]
MQGEGSRAALASSACRAKPPLLLHLGRVITPQSLRRARQYVDLLANPPSPPHPFGVFLEEAARLRSRAAAAASHNTARCAENGEGVSSGSAVVGAEDAEVSSLLELLRREQGYSTGSAMHRIWVQQPREYLAGMAQRIADLVLTRVMPLVAGERKGGEYSHSQSEANNTSRKTQFVKQERGNYDIHVRFLPSSASSLQVHAPIAKVFCAEITVREAEALRRLEEDADLLRTQYTSVAAEGQTVQSALAFWRAIKMDAAAEENEGPSADDALSAVVLGRARNPADEKRARMLSAGGADALWMQPPNKRPRQAAASTTAAAGINLSSRRKLAAPQTTGLEPPRVPLQSTAGLVAVFYLAFSGTLYTGVLCGAAEEGDPYPAPVPHRTYAASDGSVTGKRVETTATPLDAEPVFFLPCAASNSFVRGLLGL